jgi:hypothetical protein
VHLWHAHAPQMSDGFFSDENRTPFATESLVKENRSSDVHVRRPNIVRKGLILWQKQGPRAGSIDVDGLRGFGMDACFVLASNCKSLQACIGAARTLTDIGCSLSRSSHST